MVRWLACALILILPACSTLKEKGIRATCRCSWDNYFLPPLPPLPPPKDNTP
jgi:hypothetical protein